jgi:hypothetical protein
LKKAILGMENQFIFTRPLTYELKDNGDLIVSLDISTTEPDLVNDIVTLNFLKSMQKQILEQNKKLDIEHESFRGKSVEEKEINKTKIPAGRMMEPTISEYKNEKQETHHRLNIKGIINKFRNDYEDIKGNILEKFLDAGSIAFIPTRFRKEEKAGTIYRFLDDGILLNTALTGNPINTTAQMRSIISKSIDSLEEYQKSKETDPSIENKLEVKSAASDKKKEENVGDTEDENLTEEEKKKKKEQVKTHDHISDTTIKLQEVKNNMGEEKTAENVDVKDVKVEANLEMKAQLDFLTKENAEQKSEMETLKSKIAEMDAVLSQSVKKSKPETKSKDFAEAKSYPLDLIH